MKTFMMRSMMPPLARIHSGVIRLSNTTTGCGFKYGNAGLVRRLGSGNSMLPSCLLRIQVLRAMLKKTQISRFCQVFFYTKQTKCLNALKYTRPTHSNPTRPCSMPLHIDVPRRSQVLGDTVIMENKLLRSQIPGDWPMYVHGNANKSILPSDKEQACMLMPPESILRMLYVSSEQQCYIVEQNPDKSCSVFTLVRPEYWLNGISPRNSLFCALEYKKTQNDKTVLGLFDVLMLDNIMLTHLPIFERVARLHRQMDAIPPAFKNNSNIEFHFVGQQESVLQYRNANIDNLCAYTPVQLVQPVRSGSNFFELMPLVPPHTSCL